ncbi:glycine zipper family protein [Pseudolabrys taiwanensis]|uniref:Glycine zipper family protein n=1 Tax=Pseudolabrys taiwanensis TaxID=331696 RepID=A0A345ZQM1_9HYPH|nr:YMGG-like glycine zipper-containing protein [Pseudolabrys taiwanensis]AXK79218.1 glycine zipper family protein [Pseudolabrys taiwanensis]
MILKTSHVAVFGLLCLGLAGCASTGPAEPQVSVMPGRGKSYAAFQRDDQYCQSSAQAAVGYRSPGEEANQQAAQSAVIGTALGALGGAAIGSLSGNVGAGAAIGAGTGLAAGAVVGSNRAAATGGSIQQRYDTVYAQCMTAKGNVLPPPPATVVVQEPAPVYVERPYYGRRYYGW